MSRRRQPASVPIHAARDPVVRAVIWGRNKNSSKSHAKVDRIMNPRREIVAHILLLFVAGRQRASERLSFQLCTLETGLHPLNQQIALELSDGIEHVMVTLPAKLVRSAPPSARQQTLMPISANALTVVLTPIASRPSRSSSVTISTSPASSLSISREKPRRCAMAVLPETVSVTIRRGSMRAAVQKSATYFLSAMIAEGTGVYTVELYLKVRLAVSEGTTRVR